MRRPSLHRLHKWVGLSAAAWLVVLASTGFLLDHRDSWRWLWQDGVALTWMPHQLAHKASSEPFKLYQIDPLNHADHITGGQSGLWWSSDAGQTWQASHFIDRIQAPQVYAALFTVSDSSSEMWLATDIGVWHSEDSGRTVHVFALAGKRITALTQGEAGNSLLGVADRSEVFRLNTRPASLVWARLSPVSQAELPSSITLSRFVRDLHYGRGLFTAPLSMLWSDLAAIALLVLPLTGLLFFYLPRRWRRKKQQGAEVDHRHKRISIRWLFRLHAPLFGVLACIPLLYLAITGIILDHSDGFANWLKSTNVTRSWQTPVYTLNSWQDEISSIVGYIAEPGKFSLGTRLGLYTTTDNGQHWQREHLPSGDAWYIWSLRRSGDQIFLGGMGGPNLLKEGQGSWQVAKGTGHMPTDMVRLSEHDWWVKGHHGIKLGSLTQGFHDEAIVLPRLGFAPWFYVLDGLHSGLIFHEQWKWLNDLFALAAIFLVITGLLRWWRKKWI